MNTTKLLLFIRSYYLSNGVPPSVREMAEAMGFKSPRAVSYHLEHLMRQGVLIQRKGYGGMYIPKGFKVVEVVDNNS